jgi:hypothetical protein
MQNAGVINAPAFSVAYEVETKYICKSLMSWLPEKGV